MTALRETTAQWHAQELLRYLEANGGDSAYAPMSLSFCISYLKRFADPMQQIVGPCVAPDQLVVRFRLGEGQVAGDIDEETELMDQAPGTLRYQIEPGMLEGSDMPSRLTLWGIAAAVAFSIGGAALAVLFL